MKNADINLFIDLVPAEKQHQHYKQIKNDEFVISVINNWVDDKILQKDGKNKFIKEFQTEFNSCFWELYIYQCLKKCGCDFDFQYDFPDFVVTMPAVNQRYTVECTIANNANGTVPEFDIDSKINDTVSLEEKVYIQTIRLANSITSKHKKYIENYSCKTWVSGIPYIIAVAPFEQPNSFSVGNEGILAVLFGELLNRHTLSYKKVSIVYKNSTTEIPLGLFKRKEFAEISAVLFSTVATIGKVDAMGNNPNCVFMHIRTNPNGNQRTVRIDSRNEEYISSLCKKGGYENIHFHFYRETITDGLTLFLNPYANIPLSNKIIWEMYSVGVNILRYDIEIDDYDESLCHDNFLVHRQVLKFKEP